MSLNFTGERYLPSVGGSIELEHMHRYLFASEYVKGKVVLDIACGEGYGCNVLGRVAKRVYGVDIDEAAIVHAVNCYPASNLEFRRGDCKSIPLDDNSVDVIVSFETIEHHDHHQQMLAEFKRVMRADAILIISSPDKLEYSDLTGYSNPYHVKELYKDEFEALLGQYFTNYELQGQRVVYGSILSAGSHVRPLSTITLGAEGEVEHAAGIRKEIYLVAIASDGDIPEIRSSFYEKPVYESEVVQDLLAEKTEMERLHTEATQQLGIELEVKQSVIAGQSVALERLASELSILQKQLEECKQSNKSLAAEIAVATRQQLKKFD